MYIDRVASPRRIERMASPRTNERSERDVRFDSSVSPRLYSKFERSGSPFRQNSKDIPKRNESKTSSTMSVVIPSNLFPKSSQNRIISPTNRIPPSADDYNGPQWLTKSSRLRNSPQIDSAKYTGSARDSDCSVLNYYPAGSEPKDSPDYYSLLV